MTDLRFGGLEGLMENNFVIGPDGAPMVVDPQQKASLEKIENDRELQRLRDIKTRLSQCANTNAQGTFAQ